MPKNKKGNHPFNTGNDFINLAKDRGALVEKRGRFWKIKTPNGSTYVAPGDNKLDDYTIGNLKRWFRLLGLMLLVVGAGIVMWILQNYCIDLTSTLSMCF